MSEAHDDPQISAEKPVLAIRPDRGDPMVVLQVVLVYLVVQRQFDGVTRQMTAGVASELSYVIGVADRAETAEAARAEISRASNTLGFPISLTPGRRPAQRRATFVLRRHRPRGGG